MQDQERNSSIDWILRQRLPNKSHSKLSTTEKRQSKAKYVPWNSKRFEFVKKISMPHLVNSLRYIKCAKAQVAPDLLKVIEILLDTTVTRSAADREDLKPQWKSEQRPHFSRWSTSLLFTRKEAAQGGSF